MQLYWSAQVHFAVCIADRRSDATRLATKVQFRVHTITNQRLGWLNYGAWPQSMLDKNTHRLKAQQLLSLCYHAILKLITTIHHHCQKITALNFLQRNFLILFVLCTSQQPRNFFNCVRKQILLRILFVGLKAGVNGVVFCYDNIMIKWTWPHLMCLFHLCPSVYPVTDQY